MRDMRMGRVRVGVADRHRAGGDQQLVVGEARGPVRRADLDFLLRAVDRGRLAVRAHADIEPRGEFRGRHHREPRPVLDHAADMIRQSAIRIGDLASLLEKDDLRLFVEPPQPCRSARPRRHTTDDDVFHLDPPLVASPTGILFPTSSTRTNVMSVWKTCSSPVASISRR